MTRNEIIVALDEEIQRLEQVRSLLQRSRERTADLLPKSAVVKPAKRKMSAEGRQRIIEAQRRRWAKQKREAVAKVKKAA
jgi:hypothetical protein